MLKHSSKNLNLDGMLSTYAQKHICKSTPSKLGFKELRGIINDLFTMSLILNKVKYINAVSKGWSTEFGVIIYQFKLRVTVLMRLFDIRNHDMTQLLVFFFLIN